MLKICRHRYQAVQKLRLLRSPTQPGIANTAKSSIGGHLVASRTKLPRADPVFNRIPMSLRTVLVQAEGSIPPHLSPPMRTMTGEKLRGFQVRNSGLSHSESPSSFGSLQYPALSEADMARHLPPVPLCLNCDLRNGSKDALPRYTRASFVPRSKFCRVSKSATVTDQS